ncbi:Vacuolar protein sorting-associated protein 29 [Coniosporium tulheliwenetii]|uniref:Vacuolar protein sorting-associated protein 29 n=1 Tax=Coniosporium tulheliwenetii TaxID=3383036 RepID=A0ACC2Z498_9PEZI|nr:Vacuolar protein sorting-associated protein 29 [Cladosporium sp. JES 115]
MTSRLVLCLGDLFIPDRAADIPTKPITTVQKTPDPRQNRPNPLPRQPHLPATYDFLRALSPDLQLVRGDFDTEALLPPNLSSNLALSKVVTHGSLRIGFTHGHTIIPPGDADSLLIAARQMDVDVLLWGGTHSATGAVGTGWWEGGEEPVPSFVLMDVQGDVLVLYVYQLRKDANGVENVGVEKVSFRKNGGGGS